ncbi:MAG: nitroreductase family deazaflavin-dependent oxidoreductase [Kineosporiaceae bacterium]
MTDQPTLSPSDWVANHTKVYLESGGEQGHEWNGVPTLLLTVTGRKTGTKRITALIYGRDGDDYVIVASRGGAPDHPQWYLNLEANPDVELQVGPESFAAVARTADPDERARLWPTMTAIWPAYDEYQAKTEREIPIVVLTRR